VGNGGRGAVRARAVGRTTETAAVPRDDPVSGAGENRDLLEPGRMRTAGTVGEHDGGGVVVAGDLVVDVLTAGVNGCCSPSVGHGPAATVFANMSAPQSVSACSYVNARKLSVVT